MSYPDCTCAYCKPDTERLVRENQERIAEMAAKAKPERFVALKELLRGRWIQHHYELAGSYCLVGGLREVLAADVERENSTKVNCENPYTGDGSYAITEDSAEYDLLESLIRRDAQFLDSNVPNWNDRRDRQFDEVEALLDEAAAVCRSTQEGKP